MSRIGKKVINIPEKVTVTINEAKIVVKGPLGELTQELHKDVIVKQEGNTLNVTVKNPKEKLNRSLWGTFASIITNMITGVTVGYSKVLEINGVGFGWEVKDTKINLKVGFSHPVEYILPPGITAKSVKNVLTITGIDKQLVGSVAANIRNIKKPEPYKGKGIKYAKEVLRRKAGKQAAGASASK